MVEKASFNQIIIIITIIIVVFTAVVLAEAVLVIKTPEILTSISLLFSRYVTDLMP